MTTMSWTWPASHAANLADDKVERYLIEQGAVIVRGAVSQEVCAAALRRVNARLERALAESGQASTAVDPGGVAATVDADIDVHGVGNGDRCLQDE